MKLIPKNNINVNKVYELWILLFKYNYLEGYELWKLFSKCIPSVEDLRGKGNETIYLLNNAKKNELFNLYFELLKIKENGI